MNVFYEKNDNELIIYLKGELGNYEARLIMKEIENLLLLFPKKDVVLDLKDLTFMDSSGIAVIMKTFKNTKDKRDFIVRNAPNLAMKIFSASGICKFVNFA